MKPLLVIRGHQTRDIQGIQNVIGQSTLNTILPLIQEYEEELDIATEYYLPTKQELKDHCAQVRDKIYVGGTGSLWYNLRNHITHKFGPDYSYEDFTIYKPFRFPYSVKKVKLSSMIYERKLRNGTKIVALYGSSHTGTQDAVHRYLKSSDMPYSMLTRIMINELVPCGPSYIVKPVMRFER